MTKKEYILECAKVLMAEFVSSNRDYSNTAIYDLDSRIIETFFNKAEYMANEAEKRNLLDKESYHQGGPG